MSIIQINVLLSNLILQHSIVNKFMPSSVLVGFVTMCCFRKYPYFPCLRRDFNLSPSHPFGDSTSSSHFPLNIIIILSVRHPSPLGISSDLLRAGRDILIIETTKFVLLLLTHLPVIWVCELLTSDCRRGSSFLRRY